MFEELYKEKIEEILDEPEPTLDRDQTTIISLDQKIWGQLHVGRHNPESEYADDYDIVRQSVDDGDAIYPFSFARFIETDAHLDETFKSQLYELMIDLSNNSFIRNYFDAIGAEITAYLMKHADYLPDIDPAYQVFGRGLIDPYGRPRITQDGEPIKGEWKFHRFLRSEYASRQVIQSDDALSYIRDKEEGERAEYVESIDAARQDALDFGDTDEERRQIVSARSFRNDMVPGLVSTAAQLDVDLRNILRRDSTFNTFDDFLTQFPTYYCHLSLTYGRDSHWDREIEANDLADVMALAVAIPYTDVVVTEQFFGGVAYKQSLHKQFDTTIRTDLHELSDYLTDG